MTATAGVRWVGEYVTRMPFCNNRVATIRRRDGRVQVYGVNYSTEGKSSAFLVDPATGESEKFPLTGEKGAYANEAGPDGRLYLGTFAGRLFVLDPDGERAPQLLCEPFPNEMCWGGYMSRHGESGLMFFGTNPTGSFGVWDVAKQKLVHTEVGAFEEGSHSAREFLDLPDGRVLVCVSGADVKFAHYDPVGHRLSRWFVPEGLKGSAMAMRLQMVGDELMLRDFPRDEIVFLDWRDFTLRRRVKTPGWWAKLINGRVMTIDQLKGTLLELEGDTWKPLGVPVPHAWGDFTALDERTVAGITVDGTFFRFDLRSGESFTRVLPTEEKGGMYATALASDGAGTVYVAPYINQHLVRMDLGSGASEDLGCVTVHVGQMTVMRWLDGKLFAGHYTDAGAICYDPKQPWEFLKNPKHLGLAGEQQNRPVGRMDYDGRHLYFATGATYGALGGAIVQVDPVSGAMRAFRHVIPDQNLTGVVVDPQTGLIFVAGTIEGDQGTAVPRTAEARWAAWDPRSGRGVGGGSFGGRVKTAHMLEATGTGYIVGHHDGGFFAIRTSDLALVEGPVPPAWASPTNIMLRASDGKLYGLGGGKLYRWDPASGEAVALADAFGRCLIEASPGRLVFNTLARIAEFRI